MKIAYTYFLLMQYVNVFRKPTRIVHCSEGGAGFKHARASVTLYTTGKSLTKLSCLAFKKM